MLNELERITRLGINVDANNFKSGSRIAHTRPTRAAEEIEESLSRGHAVRVIQGSFTALERRNSFGLGSGVSSVRRRLVRPHRDRGRKSQDARLAPLASHLELRDYLSLILQIHRSIGRLPRANEGKNESSKLCAAPRSHFGSQLAETK